MNYLLDTCVIFELVNPEPDPCVVKWIGSQEEENLFLSVLTIGELQKGISILTDGQKKQQLHRWLQNDLHKRFSGRILEIGIGTVHVWGQVLGSCGKRATTLSAIDSLIASQGIFHQMTIVTRNISDMEHSGVALLNPWNI